MENLVHFAIAAVIMLLVMLMTNMFSKRAKNTAGHIYVLLVGVTMVAALFNVFTVALENIGTDNVVLHNNFIVTVKVNGSNHTVGLVNGKGNFTLSGLANGTYIINAVFAGDDKYVNSTSNQVILKVNKIVTSIDVGVVSPVTYGGVATITVTMNPSINDYVVLNVVRINNLTIQVIYINQ